jgi:hypothetical protein
MGAYNILIAKVQCQNCHCLYKGKVQFKFGDTWQLEYKIGDKIKWGGNDIGRPDLSKVKAYGIIESSVCPNCGYNNNDEYDIYIEDNIIMNVSPLSDIKDYNFDEDGNFSVNE